MGGSSQFFLSFIPDILCGVTKEMGAAMPPLAAFFPCCAVAAYQ